ncbi:ornithine decarboxylase-like [Physella acuta]|uniref:ornithine decarboxylase-like n=1 Tax=Physella acuta TaxID=109671 RepID=UPI0027DB7550|nr:ornithine decarboxylase-like [Physella acuta]
MKHKYSSITSVEIIADPMPCMTQLIQDKIDELENRGSDDAFCVCDIGDVVNKFKTWKELVPRVEPFYACKCNTDEVVVKTLADLGAGFDCASKGEISLILKQGVPTSRIIYANPCKQKSFIKYAAKHNIDMMTFDNEAELIKIKDIYPSARLVLRILPTSQIKVQCQLGNKFGCHPSNVYKLLNKAKQLNLNIMGISFHCGSGVQEAKAFSLAVKQAHDAWKIACDLGFNMTFLDIGGGFPGQKSAPITFPEIAALLNDALDTYFPADMGVRIIAEPGRYFVASAYTLAVNIIAKRTVARDISDADGPPDGHNQQEVTNNDEPSHMYYVNDGVYGSFNCIMYDHATAEAHVFSDSPLRFTSSVWGPTCDGLDCIIKECRLPEMEVGQWMYFPDMGAYTIAAGSTFNGMPRPTIHYICSRDTWNELYPDSTSAKRRCESVSSEAEYPCMMAAGPDVMSLREAANSISCIEDELVLA